MQDPETEPKTPSCRELLTGAIILLLNNVIVAFYFFLFIMSGWNGHCSYNVIGPVDRVYFTTISSLD